MRSIHNTTSRSPLIHLSPVKIIRVLGEGGFSFVYLAQDEHSGVGPVTFARCMSAHSVIEAVCVEEDSLSQRTRRCSASDARGGGIQAFQVSLEGAGAVRYSKYFSRHPNIIRIMVSRSTPTLSDMEAKSRL